jgi:glycosyltransferase involved in cell wall biosynthesis
MRILLVNDYSTPQGGAEISQLVLRDALRRRGHEVRQFASRAAKEGGGEADYECFGTVSRFRTLLQMFNPWAAMELRRALRDFRPDVVHVRIFLTQLSPSILPVLRSVPSLHHVTWHRAVCPVGTKVLPDGAPCREPAGLACCRRGCLPRRDWPFLLTQIWLWRKWVGAFRLTVANSEDTRRLLEAEGFQVSQTLWNGVPVVPERPRLSDPPTLFFAGRLVPQKGPDILLRAFALGTQRVPQARLLIAGDGQMRAELEGLARSLRITPIFLGHLNSPALEIHASSAWAQVVPARCSESFGNAAAEAMMRGTAVIASASGAMADYIRNGETGILTPPGNVQALSEAIARVLSDREATERMGRNARASALQYLTADAWAERFETLYQKCA